MIETWGDLPFLGATEATLEDRLRVLIESREMRQEYAVIGMEHVQRFHDEKVVAEKLRDIYVNAPPSVMTGRPTPLSGRERRALVMA